MIYLLICNLYILFLFFKFFRQKELWETTKVGDFITTTSGFAGIVLAKTHYTLSIRSETTVFIVTKNVLYSVNTNFLYYFNW